MFQESQNLIPGTWAGWSTISPNNEPQFHYLVDWSSRHRQNNVGFIPEKSAR